MKNWCPKKHLRSRTFLLSCLYVLQWHLPAVVQVTAIIIYIISGVVSVCESPVFTIHTETDRPLFSEVSTLKSVLENTILV